MPDAAQPGEPIQVGVSRLWMEEDGILRGEPVPGGESTTQTVKEVIAAIGSMTGGTRPPLLYDLRGLSFVQADARHLAVREFHRFVSAAAILVDGGVSSMLADFFKGVDPGEMPIEIFTDAGEARAWLKGLD